MQMSKKGYTEGIGVSLGLIIFIIGLAIWYGVYNNATVKTYINDSLARLVLQFVGVLFATGGLVLVVRSFMS